MSRLPLMVACASYDRTHALETGSIRPDGIDLNFVSTNPGESFWRQLRYAEFDVCEMSMSAYIVLTARGDRRFIAIPVFTSRAFRHNSIFVSTRSGVTAPAELAGKRVGVPQYHMTAALWIRGILSDEYGVPTTTVTWVQGGLERAGYPERIDFDLPAEIRLERRSDCSLSDLLLAGELDGIIGAEVPAPFTAGDDRIRRLIPDYVQVEQDYYRRTGFFPIMHVLTIRQDVYQEHHWVARSLFDAFSRAKERVVSQLYFPGAPITILPWQVPAHLEAVSVMGADYWPYGFARNRREIEAMCRYSREQGLSGGIADVGSLFAPETADEVPLSARESPLAVNPPTLTR